MKIIRTSVFILVAATSFAFADSPTTAQPAATGPQTVQGPQSDSGVVVKKEKKKDMNGSGSNSTRVDQNGQNGGASR